MRRILLLLVFLLSFSLCYSTGYKPKEILISKDTTSTIIKQEKPKVEIIKSKSIIIFKTDTLLIPDLKFQNDIQELNNTLGRRIESEFIFLFILGIFNVAFLITNIFILRKNSHKKLKR